MAQLQGRLRVLVEEGLLNRRGRRLMLEDDVGQLVEQPHQPRGQGIGRPGGDLPVRDMGESVANGGDDAPAGAVEAGIDAEAEARQRVVSGKSVNGSVGVWGGRIIKT